MIPRYCLPEMAAIWTEEAKLERWILVEVLATEAWAARIFGAETSVSSRVPFASVSSFSKTIS